MPISEFCQRDVVCATPETTVSEAASLMRRHHIGDVIIVEKRDGKQLPIGIVTDRDIVIEVIAAGIDPTLLKLGDLQLKPLLTIEEGASYAPDSVQDVGRGCAAPAGCRRRRNPYRDHHLGRHVLAARRAAGGAGGAYRPRAPAGGLHAQIGSGRSMAGASAVPCARQGHLRGVDPGPSLPSGGETNGEARRSKQQAQRARLGVGCDMDQAVMRAAVASWPKPSGQTEPL